MEWKVFKKKLLKDPEFKKEYEKLTQKHQKEKNKKSDADLVERLKRGSSDANNKKGRFV